jgi:hypothetical protein
MVNTLVRCTPYRAILAAGSSILLTLLVPLDKVTYRYG